MPDTTTPQIAAFTCPLCQGQVEALEALWQCSQCRWVLWREIGHRRISDTVARALCETGRTDVLSGFTSKAGKEFSAALVLDDEGKVVFQFPERPSFPTEPVGTCPACGADLIEREKSYSCANWKTTGCKYTIWRDVAGHAITRQEVQTLLTGGTITISGRGRSGKRFQARATLTRETGHVDLEFVGDRDHGDGGTRREGHRPIGEHHHSHDDHHDAGDDPDGTWEDE